MLLTSPLYFYDNHSVNPNSKVTRTKLSMDDYPSFILFVTYISYYIIKFETAKNCKKITN